MGQKEQEHNFSKLREIARNVGVENFDKISPYFTKEPEYKITLPIESLFDENEENFQSLINILELAKQLNKPYYCVMFSYIPNPRSFSELIYFKNEFNILDREKLKIFKSKTKLLKDNYPNINFIIKEGFDINIYYDIENFEIVNDLIYGIVDKIQNMNIDGQPLSEFEKFLVVKNIVGQLEYSLEEKNEPNQLSRTLTGILSSNHICCSGYSLMMTEILRNLGISIFNIGAGKLETSIDNADHTLNCLRINDDKYNIHGIYFSDITFTRTMPLFTLLTYHEIEEYYKIINTELKSKFSGIPIIEEASIFFEDDKENKTELTDKIYKFVFSNKESFFYNLIKEVCSSDTIKNDIQTLKNDKDNIIGIMEEAFKSIKYMQPEIEKPSEYMTSEEISTVLTSMVHKDISKLLDTYLTYKGDISRVKNWLPDGALNVMSSLSSEYLLNIYKQELNRFLPTPTVKQNDTLKPPADIFYDIIQNLPYSMYKPSISKLIKQHDFLWGDTAYGQLVIKQTTPVETTLIKTTEEKLASELDIKPKTNFNKEK